MISGHFSPALWQSALIALVIVALLSDAPRMRRLKLMTSPAGRLSAFRSTTIGLWIAALLACFLVWPHDLFSVRLRAGSMDWLLGSPVATAGAAVLATLYFALGLGPGLHCALKPTARVKYSAGLASLQYMLPVSAHERRWWVALSVTAGVCEEVFFRGFLPLFLTGQLHHGWTLNPTAAYLLGALAFGLCHFYQGAAGIVRTALAALMFSLVSILSGGLLLPIILHVLVDLALLSLYRPLLDTPAQGTLTQRG